MLIEEIKPRTKIIISVTNGTDMQARFASKVMKNGGNYILTIPFKHKGMRINFNGKNVKIHMEVRDENGLLWSFRNCHITTTRKEGLLYHKIICGMNKGIENRRGGRRFYIWEKAVFHVEGIENPLFTNLRDLGTIGFSFVVDSKKPIEIKEGNKVVCMFKNKEGEELSINGMVVRREPLEKYVVYGCKMDAPDDKVLTYIKWLERKNIVVDAEI